MGMCTRNDQIDVWMMMNHHSICIFLIWIVTFALIIPSVFNDHVEVGTKENQTCTLLTSEIDFLDYLEHRPQMNLTTLFPDGNFNTSINSTCDLSNLYQYPIVTIDTWDDFKTLVTWIQINETIRNNPKIDFTTLNYYIQFFEMFKAGIQNDGKTAMTDFLCTAWVNVRYRYKLINKTTGEYKTGFDLAIGKAFIEDKEDTWCGGLSMVTNYIHSVIFAKGSSINDTKIQGGAKGYEGPFKVYNEQNFPLRNNGYLNRVRHLFNLQIVTSIYIWGNRTIKDQEYEEAKSRRKVEWEGWGKKFTRYTGLSFFQGKIHLIYDWIPFFIKGGLAAHIKWVNGKHPLKRNLFQHVKHRVLTMLKVYHNHYRDKHYVVTTFFTKVWGVIKMGWTKVPEGWNTDGLLDKIKELEFQKRHVTEFHNKPDKLKPWLYEQSIDDDDEVEDLENIEIHEETDAPFDLLQIFFPSSYLNPHWSGYGPNDTQDYVWCFPADPIFKIFYLLTSIRRFDIFKNVPFFYQPTDLSQCLMYPFQLADPSLPNANCLLGTYGRCPDVLTDENRDDLLNPDYYNRFNNFRTFWRGIFLFPWYILSSAILKPFTCLLSPIPDLLERILSFIVFNPNSCVLSPNDFEPGESIRLLIIFITLGIVIQSIIITYLLHVLVKCCILPCSVNATVANLIPVKNTPVSSQPNDDQLLNNVINNSQMTEREIYKVLLDDDSDDSDYVDDYDDIELKDMDFIDDDNGDDNNGNLKRDILTL